MIPAPEPEHYCPSGLPWATTGYGSTGQPDGTLEQCETCGCWWFSSGAYSSLGPTSRWYRVRWYHRTFRQRIAAAQQPSEQQPEPRPIQVTMTHRSGAQTTAVVAAMTRQRQLGAETVSWDNLDGSGILKLDLDDVTAISWTEAPRA